ncbi:MAG: hypothetical protein J3R72DRAFT_508693 [Linnemannia gamsii]|nr:MAG: hypothetical protein J3R72DRAFT_508693 [Linnemannia gamsii]
MQSYNSDLLPQRFQHVVHRRRCGVCYTLSIRPRLSVYQDTYILVDDLRRALGYYGEILLFLDEHQTKPLTIFNHRLALGECTAYYPDLTLFYRLVDQYGKTILNAPSQDLPQPGPLPPSQFNSYQSGGYSHNDHFSTNLQRQQLKQESNYSQPRPSSPTRFNSYQQGDHDNNYQNYNNNDSDYDSNHQDYDSNHQDYDSNHQDYNSNHQDYNSNHQDHNNNHQDHNSNHQDYYSINDQDSTNSQHQDSHSSPTLTKREKRRHSIGNYYSGPSSPSPTILEPPMVEETWQSWDDLHFYLEDGSAHLTRAIDGLSDGGMFHGQAGNNSDDACGTSGGGDTNSSPGLHYDPGSPSDYQQQSSLFLAVPDHLL